MKKFALLLLFTSFGLSAQAQSTPISIQVGADAYQAASYPNGSITILGGDTTRVGITVGLNPTGLKTFGQFTYSARAALEHAVFENDGVEFHLIGQAGVASSTAQVGLIISGGGGAIFKTTKLKGWQPVVNIEAEAFPANNTPTLSVNAGFRKTWGKP